MYKLIAYVPFFLKCVFMCIVYSYCYHYITVIHYQTDFFGNKNTQRQLLIGQLAVAGFGN